MDWENERYVRMYTRDTGDMLAIGWEGRAVLSELLRKVDRAGILDESDTAIVSEMLRVPLEIVDVALPKMVRRGVIEIVDEQIILPNFIAAQEAKSSDKQRQAESRARRREKARAGNTNNRSRRVTDGHDESHSTVTHGHTASHDVTPSLAEPSQTVPSLAEPVHTCAPPARVEFDLDSIYEIYPRKKGKANGLKRLTGLVRTQEVFEAVLAGAQAMQVVWAPVPKADRELCPYFSSWVSAKGWEDEDPPVASLPRQLSTNTGRAGNAAQQWAQHAMQLEAEGK